MGMIDKGLIVSLSDAVDGVYTKAKVQSVFSEGATTMPLTIPVHLRGEKGLLKKGTEVVYTTFKDETGIILHRMDGNTY